MARELLFSVSAKDCEWHTFRAGGKGGQKQNKTETGVRCTHRASGAVGEARDSASQKRNRQAAFLRMAESPTFVAWRKRVSAELMGEPSIDERVDKMMRPENLHVDVKDERGRWTPETVA